MFSDEVSEIEDLKPGMKLKGTVTNVTNFGAFVDIGVHQDGLVHISELSDQFVKDPATVVAVGTILDVRVLEVDAQRRRISLSCKSESSARPSGPSQGQPRQDQSRFQSGPSQNRPGGNAERPSFGGSGQGGQGGQGNQRGQRGRDQNRGGAQQGRGGNQGPQHSTAPRNKPQQPSQSFTIDDLLSKFGNKK
jgi:uncharacterized protein